MSTKYKTKVLYHPLPKIYLIILYSKFPWFVAVYEI